MAENEIKLNLDGMGHLARLLKKAGATYIKVGVLGSTAHRTKGKQNNAEIGFIQEFGRMENPRILARSFLRMPLKTHLRQEIEHSKTFNEQSIERAIADGNAKKMAKKLGILAEKIVLESFETSGDGKWAPNAPYTVAMKGSDKPLIDTGELRKSITSQVVEK